MLVPRVWSAGVSESSTVCAARRAPGWAAPPATETSDCPAPPRIAEPPCSPTAARTLHPAGALTFPAGSADAREHAIDVRRVGGPGEVLTHRTAEHLRRRVLQRLRSGLLQG